MKILILVGTVLIFATRASYADTSFLSLNENPPGGQWFSTPYAMSENGRVVVGAGDYMSGNQAIRWTQEEGTVGFGLLTQAARGVSGDGKVMVGRTSGDMAFLWSETDLMLVGLGYLPGHDRSSAYGASYDGLVVVGESGPSTGGSEAFRWTEETGMVGLGAPSYAESVSSDGSVVVGTGGGTAFRWTESQGMVSLGSLPGGAATSYGKDVSGNGSVVVGYGSSSSGTQAFRWTEEDGMVGLGYLSGGTVERSEAHAVSSDGLTVVGSSYSSWGEIAFIWDAENGMRPLRDVLIDDFGLDLTGWTLARAYDVSSDGFIIVGNGGDPNGNQVAWIAVIPEPITLMLFALGGFTLIKRRGLYHAHRKGK